MEVAGERFRVWERADDVRRHTYDYDWLSGPNPGYGFSSSGVFELTHEEHASSIRDFLAGIDPATGYLGDT